MKPIGRRILTFARFATVSSQRPLPAPRVSARSGTRDENNPIKLTFVPKPEMAGLMFSNLSWLAGLAAVIVVSLVQRKARRGIARVEPT